MPKSVARESIAILVTGMPANNRGFTLIEILVVLLIVGITLGFALLAFGDFGSTRRIIVAAEQFKRYVQLVQQQAILETSTFGINLKSDGYQVLRFKPPANWIPMPLNSILHREHTIKNLIITVEQTTNHHTNPAIIINSSGDMNAFTLDFGSAKQMVITQIVGLPDGTLRLSPEKKP